jgi:hypothetical protein
MTLTKPDTVKNLLKDDGFFEDGIRAESIWEYKSPEGKTLWAVFTTAAHDMFSSPFVMDPKLLWSSFEGKIADVSI